MQFASNQGLLQKKNLPTIARQLVVHIFNIARQYSLIQQKCKSMSSYPSLNFDNEKCLKCANMNIKSNCCNNNERFYHGYEGPTGIGN